MWLCNVSDKLNEMENFKNYEYCMCMSSRYCKKKKVLSFKIRIEKGLNEIYGDSET